ncbi:NADH:ubiquinone oxidoreductase [Vibrio gallicus]|uniref:NADH:ubiquinone oxidoreductase n=1 Tax=Vibrio gallicus TaxID=190897 RepID=UPI0021C3B220|nr:NADH:ubiquinone oxidoreductase [Vibrio gallicus]
MKIFLLLLVSVSAGAASAEHLNSFLYGLSTASLAVGTCFWFAFRSSRWPQLAVFMLLVGMLSKLLITVIATMMGVKSGIITSPLVFSLSYLFFALAVSYVYFYFKDRATNRRLGLNKA